jgi:hypothetical protein
MSLNAASSRAELLACNQNTHVFGDLCRKQCAYSIASCDFLRELAYVNAEKTGRTQSRRSPQALRDPLAASTAHQCARGYRHGRQSRHLCGRGRSSMVSVGFDGYLWAFNVSALQSEASEGRAGPSVGDDIDRA